MAYVPQPIEPEFRALTQQHVEMLTKKGCYHSLELLDGTVIPGHISVEALRGRIESFPIPRDLTGMRVLDTGAASGWNSFEMERRGASVMAVDCVRFSELDTVREMRGSSVDYRILDVDELTPEECGLFDYTLFFGVLYHLRHPLLGLEKICAVTKETAYIESFVVDSVGERSGACVLEFYEIDQLGGQIDNWFGPTITCLEALCRSAGFARVRLEYATDRRAGLTCDRRWEAPPDEPPFEAPWICSAVNNRTSDFVFHPGKDEYIVVYFRSEETLAKDDLRVEVDGYGAPAIALAPTVDGEWQASLRVPPGLALGSHVVRMRTRNSGFSNSVEIEVARGRGTTVRPAIAGSAPAPVLIAVESSSDMGSEFHGYRNELLNCRFTTDDANLKREEMVIALDNVMVPAFNLTRPSPGEWQVAVQLPSDLANGEHLIRVGTVRNSFSAPGRFTSQR
jgi:SAM-dependent methyltransferase